MPGRPTVLYAEGNTARATYLAAALSAQELDDEVRLHVPLAPVDSGMRGAIASLRPGGSTNLSGGWLKGLEQLRPAPADGVRKILVTTADEQTPELKFATD